MRGDISNGDGAMAGPDPMSAAVGASLWIIGTVGYLALEALTARHFEPSYSYARNYISDLGVVTHSARADLMHIAFYLQGSLFFFGAALLTRRAYNRTACVFLAFVAINAVGNVLVGTVHSGHIHVLGAALAIVGGNAAILAGAAAVRAAGAPSWFSWTSNIIAGLGFLSLTLLLVDSATTKMNLFTDGVWERGSVYSIIGWQLFAAACVVVSVASMYLRARD